MITIFTPDCNTISQEYYDNTISTVMEFYRNLVTALGQEPFFRKADNCRIIQTEITRLALEKKVTPIIIIDEANHISNAILNDLKILFNFEMDSRDRAVILLAGLPQLNNTLRLGIHEPLKQRIVMNYNIDLLSKEEAHTYILGKLKGAGCNQPVFEDNALEAIISISVVNSFSNMKITSLPKGFILTFNVLVSLLIEIKTSSDNLKNTPKITIPSLHIPFFILDKVNKYVDERKQYARRYILYDLEMEIIGMEQKSRAIPANTK